MKLIITIDTEEDNWRPFSPRISTHNAREIARVHDLFVAEDVRPSYLVTWPMAMDDVLVDTLIDENRSGRCEIGMHCHPWTTPPFGETPRLENSMLCNLAPAQVAAKMEGLHALLTDRFGTAPRTFRAGRWGFGPNVAEVLDRLDYRVDTSITAFTDWSAEFGPDYSLIGPQPYRFAPSDIYTPCASGTLLELPATGGFLQAHYSWHARFERLARRRPLRSLRLIGLTDRLALHNRVTLSPECAGAQQMIGLIDNMHAMGFEYLNMFFHSPTLVPGLTPFVATERDRDDFLHTLRTVIRHAKRVGSQSILAREITDPKATGLTGESRRAVANALRPS